VTDPERCPLCADSAIRQAAAAHGGRPALHACGCCRLIFVSRADRPSAEAAERRYRLHRNSIEDAGYVRFLCRLLDPVVARLTAGARGLDYGSGPEPVLAELARRAGFACDAYDPVFAPRPPRPLYDFVLASEVCEHFADPPAEFARLRACLRPGGLLGVMTEFWRSEESLADWPYRSDPTHVVFYREETFAWIASAWGFERLWSDGSRVVLLRRPAGHEETKRGDP
jgi:SAM-dependent methyltransferase